MEPVVTLNETTKENKIKSRFDQDLHSHRTLKEYCLFKPLQMMTVNHYYSDHFNNVFGIDSALNHQSSRE